jgi:hypothetical protein
MSRALKRGQRLRMTDLDDKGMKVALADAYERLTIHLDALAAGRLAAIRDTSALLRTLIASGAGNNLLRRAMRRFGLDEPVVRVGPQLVRDSRGSAAIVLAFGGLPIIDGPGRDVPITNWIESVALVHPGLHRDSYTWAEYVNHYANTYGSHIAGSIPEVLSGTVVHRVHGNLNLGQYLICGSAINAGRALADILRQLGEQPTAELRQPGFPLNGFVAWPTADNEAVDFEMSARVTVSGPLLEFQNYRQMGARRVLRVTAEVIDDDTIKFHFENNEPAS